jgi:hypothetical protein
MARCAGINGSSILQLSACIVMTSCVLSSTGPDLLSVVSGVQCSSQFWSKRSGYSLYLITPLRSWNLQYILRTAISAQDAGVGLNVVSRFLCRIGHRWKEDDPCSPWVALHMKPVLCDQLQ